MFVKLKQIDVSLCLQCVEFVPVSLQILLMENCRSAVAGLYYVTGIFIDDSWSAGGPSEIDGGANQPPF